MALGTKLRFTDRTGPWLAGRLALALAVAAVLLAPAGVAASDVEQRGRAIVAQAERAEQTTPFGDFANLGGVVDNTYTSPTFGYELEWDDEVWEVGDEASADRDFLLLFELDGTSLVYVEGYEAYDGDAEECLEGSSDEILDQDGVEDVEPLEDEDGEEIAGEEDGRFFAAYSFVTETNDGPQDRAAYFTCETLVEDEAVLAFSFIGLLDEFEDDLPVWLDLLDGLTLPEDAADEDDAGDDDRNGDRHAGERSDDEDAQDDEPDGGVDEDDTAADDGEILASYRGGPAHTGVQPGPAPSDEPSEAWTFETGDDFAGANAVAVSVEEGLVFTSSNAIYAFDIEEGEEVWTYESEFDMGFVSPLALADGVFYAAGEDGHVYAFEPESGEVVWQTELTGNGLPVNGGPLVAGDTLYVTAWDETAYALETETGEVLWDAPIGGISFGQPVYAGGFIVFSAPANGVMAIEAESGDEAWTFETDEQVFSSPAIVDGVVYFGSDDGNLYAVELESGDEVWSVDTGAPVSAAAAVFAGVVYVANSDAVLGAYDAASGDELWTVEIDGSDIGGATVTETEDGDTQILAGDGAGVLHAFDDEGEEVYAVEVADAAIFWPPTVVDGAIYVSARDGTVYALTAT